MDYWRVSELTIDAVMNLNRCQKCGSEMRYGRHTNAQGEYTMVLQCKVCRYYFEVDNGEQIFQRSTLH